MLRSLRREGKKLSVREKRSVYTDLGVKYEEKRQYGRKWLDGNTK
jgi:hypothetical protein